MKPICLPDLAWLIDRYVAGANHEHAKSVVIARRTNYKLQEVKKNSDVVLEQENLQCMIPLWVRLEQHKLDRLRLVEIQNRITFRRNEEQ